MINEATLTNEDIDLIKVEYPEGFLKPTDMPKLEQIDQWQAMVNTKFVKVNGEKVISQHMRFEPTNLWPQHNIEKASVTYRFHVRVLLGLLPDRKTGQPSSVPRVIDDFLIDVNKFLKDYRPE